MFFSYPFVERFFGYLFTNLRNLKELHGTHLLFIDVSRVYNQKRHGFVFRNSDVIRHDDCVSLHHHHHTPGVILAIVAYLGVVLCFLTATIGTYFQLDYVVKAKVKSQRWKIVKAIKGDLRRVPTLHPKSWSMEAWEQSQAFFDRNCAEKLAGPLTLAVMYLVVKPMRLRVRHCFVRCLQRFAVTYRLGTMMVKRLYYKVRIAASVRD